MSEASHTHKPFPSAPRGAAFLAAAMKPLSAFVWPVKSDVGLKQTFRPDLAVRDCGSMVFGPSRSGRFAAFNPIGTLLNAPSDSGLALVCEALGLRAQRRGVRIQRKAT
jgi:hypothetical protein